MTTPVVIYTDGVAKVTPTRRLGCCFSTAA
jgi:hypothetical protein